MARYEWDPLSNYFVERLETIEDNNVGDVQVCVVLSQLGKRTTAIWPVP